MRKILAGVTIAIVLTVILLVAAAWAPDRPTDDLKARWATPPSVFLDLQGMAVHLRDEGIGDDTPPILLLHGTSASLHTWDGWVEALAPNHRVIRMDLPGFGLTGPFPHDDYHVTAYVDFIIALLDSLALPQVIIAGSSLGGQIAWEVAVTAPERVAALVLVNAAGYTLEPDSIPLAFRIARIPVLQPLLTRIMPRRMVAASVRDVYGDPGLVTDELVERYYELALREGNRRALGLRLDEAVHREMRADRIAMITQPTLILWGGQDRLIPPKTAERFAHDIADSRLIIFDALGHVPHEEDPESTSSAVRAFLDSMAAGHR